MLIKTVQWSNGPYADAVAAAQERADKAADDDRAGTVRLDKTPEFSGTEATPL